MKKIRCEREEELAAALAGERVGEELRRHAESCAVCGDLLLVGSFLRTEGEAARAAAEPIQATVIWRRAERRARERKLERALQPIEWIRRVAGVAAAAAAAIVALSSGPALIGRLQKLDLPVLADTFPLAPMTLEAALMTVTLAVGLAALGLYSVWAET